MKFHSIIFLLLICTGLTAQETNDTASNKKEFTISVEFRPRTEYRKGYRQLRPDTAEPAFFTEQRSRIYLNYQTNRFIFHTSIQDVRVWGEQDPRSTGGTLQLFEAYVEPSLSKHISVRIGRQKIMYDNQRLFAQNDWRQSAGAHDAVRFMYKSNKLEADLIAAFNQPQGAQERFYETYYYPTFSNYKALLAGFIKYKHTDKVVLTVINAADGFQKQTNSHIDYYRTTSGGRIEYIGKSLYLTLSGYYQYGKTATGKELAAFYLQPEIKYNVSEKFYFRTGAEIFSGDDGINPSSTTSHSFDALYGVAHRFLGSMDFFTRFPKDFNNAGVIAPYVFAFYNLNKKLELRADGHLFYSQNNFVVNGTPIDKYLGLENDLLLTYKPNSFTELQLGYSYALLTKSMEYIKGSGNAELWHDWAYLMITFKPELFRWKK